MFASLSHLILISTSSFLWILSYILFSNNSSTRPYLDNSVYYDTISPFRVLLSGLLPVFVASYGLKRRRLSKSGAYAGLVVGFILTISSYCFVSSLFVFFIVCSKATSFREHRKMKFEADYKKGGMRNWIQVFSNGWPASLYSLLYLLENGFGEKPIDFSRNYFGSWLALSVLGSIACSCGDTLASELGSVLTTRQPRLISTLKSVPIGTNGAVSFGGLVFSSLGGAIVGCAYYFTLLLCLTPHHLDISPPQWPLIGVGALSGLVGSLIDSILGATLQYSGKNSEEKVVNMPGPNVTHISGVNLLNNHSVNFISGLLSGFITPKVAFVVWSFLT